MAQRDVAHPMPKYALVQAYMFVLGSKEAEVRAKLNVIASAKFQAKLALAQLVDHAGEVIRASEEEKSADLEESGFLGQGDGVDLNRTMESLKVSRADEAMLVNALSNVLMAHRSCEELFQRLKGLYKKNQKEFNEVLGKFEFDDPDLIVR
jgi:hypothetical protein